MDIDTPRQASTKRINVIDALRGFALLGVILIHMLQNFGYSPQNINETSIFPTLDKMVQLLANHVLSGRFITIFSFLFGFSFFIQMDRASKKGSDFRDRFIWRMIILFVIGIIGTIFTYIDILTLYAFLGIILVLLFPLKNWILIIITSLILSGLPLMLIVGFKNITLNNPTVLSINEPIDSKIAKIDILDDTASEKSILIKESFYKSAKENLTSKSREKLYFQFIMSSTAYIVFALFILGFIVGKTGFFEKVNVRRRKNYTILLIFVVASIVTKFIVLALKPDNPINLFEHVSRGLKVPLVSIISSTLNDLSLLSQSGLLAMGFIVLYQTKTFGKYLEMLSPYGRMGLTNYEIQNLSGAILFSTWGFGSYFSRLSNTELFLLGLIIYSLQIIISKQWMKLFLYGPLEWIWRSGTYMKWQPFKRGKTIINI